MDREGKNGYSGGEENSVDKFCFFAYADCGQRLWGELEPGPSGRVEAVISVIFRQFLRRGNRG